MCVTLPKSVWSILNGDGRLSLPLQLLQKTLALQSFRQRCISCSLEWNTCSMVRELGSYTWRTKSFFSFDVLKELGWQLLLVLKHDSFIFLYRFAQFSNERGIGRELFYFCNLPHPRFGEMKNTKSASATCFSFAVQYETSGSLLSQI